MNTPGAFGWLVTIVLLTLSLGISVGESVVAEEIETQPTAQQLEYFERQIRPLLVARCYACHSGEGKQAEGGLRLDSREALRRGGESGPAIVAGDPEQSRLIRAVRYTDPLLQMPPDERLSSREVERLVEWVRMGAPDPRREASAPAAAAPAPVADAARSWWSFQPLRAVTIPSVQDQNWPTAELDRFVLAALEARGLRPARPADRRVLIRRATWDLTGLPPSPEEISDFLQDEAPGNFGRLIDRLLSSPRHGERWGRHWLDVVRYADTSGCNGDFPIVEAYRYRNYVIDSVNGDKPFDRFVREQIAGDLLPARSDDERFEQLIATGYLALSRRFSSLGEEFHLTLDDTVDNVGKAFLALSISCGRCHDHKFDPIPQSDYYALYGIFQSTKYAFPGTEIYRHTQHFAPLVSAERYERELRDPLERMEKLDAEIFETYSRMAEKDTGQEKNELRARWQAMQKQRDELVKSLPDFPRAYAASEGQPTEAQIHIKGDPKNLGPAVERGFLQVLGGQRLGRETSGSGRLELAQWLTADNPLTARVIVNRVWQHHFGRGLVATPDDFGTRGEPPTHPELLDYLTQRFLQANWSIKALHRMIMQSSTYQMACIEDPVSFEQDPGNKLFWTFNRRRLEAEEIRDAVLAISGSLDETRGGRHPFPPEWEWRYSQHKPFVDDYRSQRRSIYLMQQRIRQQAYLATFDGADTNAITGLRKVSTVAPQALFMLNSEFLHDRADCFADRLAREGGDAGARIDRAFQLVLGRSPADDERREAGEFLAQLEQPLAAAGVASDLRQRSAWSSYLRVLLCSNEFMFVE